MIELHSQKIAWRKTTLLPRICLSLRTTPPFVRKSRWLATWWPCSVTHLITLVKSHRIAVEQRSSNPVGGLAHVPPRKHWIETTDTWLMSSPKVPSWHYVQANYIRIYYILLDIILYIIYIYIYIVDSSQPKAKVHGWYLDTDIGFGQLSSCSWRLARQFIES